MSVCRVCVDCSFHFIVVVHLSILRFWCIVYRCGYATIHDVHLKTLEDRMESFFLSETCKYLYLVSGPLFSSVVCFVIYSIFIIYYIFIFDFLVIEHVHACFVTFWSSIGILYHSIDKTQSVQYLITVSIN